MARNKRPVKRGASWFVGRLILLLSIFAAFVFGIVVYTTGLLPLKFLILLGAFMLLVIVLVGILTWRPRRKVRYALGLLLGLVACVGMGLGTYYVSRGVSAAKDITTVSVETAEVGIYVLAEDTNDYPSVAASYTYGILETLDRENTDDAVKELNAEYNVSLALKTFDGLPKLMDALYGGNVNAVILNSAYLSLLEEMDGYADVRDRIKEVHMAHVEREVQTKTTEEKPADRLTGNVKKDGTAGEGTEGADGTDGQVFTVFLSGIDNRGALIAKSRSDVNILASINTATHQVALISTPRDFFVPLSISGGARDKLTHAGIYGVNVSMDTLAMLYNVDVDYYFRVNFAGFEDIIDALGGVTVESDQSFTSVDGYYFNAGENYVNGEEALAFVRERMAFASGDRQRGKNQLALIKGVIKKALSPELLINYNQILNAVQGSFEGSMPYETLSALIKDQLEKGGDWNVVSYSVDGTGDSQIPYSMSQYAYVMVPNESTVEAAKYMIYQVYTGQTVTAP